MMTLAYGTVALIGAGEYLSTMLPVDKALIERLNSSVRVVVLPTASAPDGRDVSERWARMGVEHFTQLGVAVEPVMLLHRAHANDPGIVAQLAAANFVYFSGGKPRYLLETLQGTTAWQAILNIYSAGGVVAGCSAGAMVLGGQIFDFPHVWRTVPGLSLVPDIAVIPHFDEIPSFVVSTAIRNRRKLPIVGIDGATALVGSVGQQWRVHGRGGVTLVTGKQKRRYLAGEEVPLAQDENAASGLFD